MEVQDEVSVNNSQNEAAVNDVNLDDLKFAGEGKYLHEIEYLRSRVNNLESFKKKFFSLQNQAPRQLSNDSDGVTHSADAEKRISELEENLKNSTNMAMLSMTTMGEYGAVVDFFKESTSVKNYEELVDAFLKTVTTYSLQVTVLVHGLDGDEVFVQSEESKELDLELIETNKEQGRIFEHDGMLSINYKNVSMLFKGFSEDDPEKKGRLLDYLAILGSGLSGSIDALNLDMKMSLQRQNLHTIVKAIPKVIEKIEHDLGTQLKKTDVMCDQMIANTSKLVKGKGLSSEVEKGLGSSLVVHKKKLHKVLAESIVIAEQFAEIMNTLERTYISSTDDSDESAETESSKNEQNFDEDVLF